MEFILPVEINCDSLVPELMCVQCITPAPPAQCWNWQNLFHLERGSRRAPKTTLHRGRGGLTKLFLLRPTGASTSFNWQNKFHPPSPNRCSMVTQSTIFEPCRSLAAAPQSMVDSDPRDNFLNPTPLVGGSLFMECNNVQQFQKYVIRIHMIPRGH